MAPIVGQSSLIIWRKYWDSASRLEVLIDAFIAYQVYILIACFLYAALQGSKDPYEILLPAVAASGGSATLAGVLRLEIGHDRPPGESLRDFLMCQVALYLAAVNFFAN